jgi:hypothetical protein
VAERAPVRGAQVIQGAGEDRDGVVAVHDGPGDERRVVVPVG